LKEVKKPNRRESGQHYLKGKNSEALKMWQSPTEQGGGGAPGIVFNVVSLIEDEDSLVDINVHGLTDDWVY
jgi:hypothetical protein